jgi:hypothetical protein
VRQADLPETRRHARRTGDSSRAADPTNDGCDSRRVGDPAAWRPGSTSLSVIRPALAHARRPARSPAPGLASPHRRRRRPSASPLPTTAARAPPVGASAAGCAPPDKPVNAAGSPRTRQHLARDRAAARSPVSRDRARKLIGQHGSRSAEIGPWSTCHASAWSRSRPGDPGGPAPGRRRAGTGG